MRRCQGAQGKMAGIAITACLLLLVGLGSCCPAWTSSDPEALGPALFEVLMDPFFTCPTDLDRDRYNVCPETRPMLGTDEQGVTWSSDRILFGLLPNPFHAPLDCLRGRSPGLGFSSYQCCYDGDELVDAGPLAGSFDFFNPLSSLGSAILHLFWDILPPYLCEP